MGLVMVLTMGAFAQGGDMKRGKEKCEFPCEKMKKELNLSDEQMAKLKAANETFEQEAKSIWEKQQEVMSTGREAMQAAEARRDEALKSTLTQEQYIKYLEGKVEFLENCPDKKMGDYHHKGDRKMEKRARHHRLYNDSLEMERKR